MTETITTETATATIRAILIPADVDQPMSFVDLPQSEDLGTLRALQGQVGGLVDVVRVADGVDMWVNDEGLLMGLPLNERAVAVVQSVKVALTTGEYPAPEGMDMAYAMEDAMLARRHTYLVGAAVIAGSNAEGETVDAPERIVDFVREMGLME